MKYRLLALDVDGTVAGADNAVSPDTARAVAEAARAGLRVCLATGRSYVETMPIWRQLHLEPPLEPLVLVGGALVSEPDTARTLYQRTMPRNLACEFADALGEAGLSAMAFVDAWRHGVDYFLAETGDVHAALDGWFRKMDVKVHRCRRLWDAADMPDPLRVSAIVGASAAEPLTGRLRERFGERLNLHAILAPNYGVTVVEAFACGTDKLAAVRYIGQSCGIVPSAICAVGDDINDLPMLRGAGLGAAMPGAKPALRDAADVIIDDSLAAFIRRLCAGEFG